MKVPIPKMFMLLISPVTCIYHSGCPHVSQAKFRRQGICDGITHYVCLFDKNDQRYKEFCSEEKDIQSEGHKSVLRGSNDGISCDHSRFQPFSYSTNIGPSCVFIKSNCCGEGQIIISNGSPTEDVSCKCDYREGYSYITMPKNRCTCNPNQEDCSCYLIRCNFNEIFNQDYQCKLLSELTGKFRCKAINEKKAGQQNEVAKNTKLHNVDKFSSEICNRVSHHTESAVLFVLACGFGILIGFFVRLKDALRKHKSCQTIARVNSIECSNIKRMTTELTLDSVQQGNYELYFFNEHDEVGHSWSKDGGLFFKVCKVNNDLITVYLKSPTKDKRGTGRKRHVSCSSYFEHNDPSKTSRRRLPSALTEVGLSRITGVVPCVKVSDVNDDLITLDIQKLSSDCCRIGRKRHVSCSSYFEQDAQYDSLRSY